jgi:hypothetical protein
MSIQDNYTQNYERGFIGQRMRVNAPWDADAVVIESATLKIGDAFKFDANGRAIACAGVDTDFEGILMYSPNRLNTVDNKTIGVFEVGKKVEYMKEGYILGVASGDLKKGDKLLWDATSSGWKLAGTATPVHPAFAVEDADSGSMLIVQIAPRVA